MKILMLIDSMGIGGAETHVLSLGAELGRQGCEVCVASGGGELVSELLDKGISHIKIPFVRCGIFGLILSFFKLRKLTERENFNIIHAHSRRAALVGSWISRTKKICFVTTAHARFKSSPIKKYMSRWGYYVSAVGKDIAEHIRREYKIDREKIKVIANGIDTQRFLENSAVRDDSTVKSILFVSRLDTDCSCAAYALCAIAKRLSERYGRIRIDIVGGGAEYELVQKCACEVNSTLGYSVVRLLGGVKDIAPLMNGYHLFVGVSRAALEAMASGIPVILAGDEGFFGVVDKDNIELARESNFCARGCDKISEDKLFEHICSVLDMKAASLVWLGEYLRGYVTENNSISLCAAKTAELYGEAISNTSLDGGDICLCGYYGFGNLGDDTLLKMAVRRARREGRAVCALTAYPRADSYRFGIKCHSRRNIFSIIKAIRCSERLVFGGGTLFQDKSSFRSLVYYFAIAETARFFGREIELWGSGLGPIESRVGRALTRRVLSGSVYVGLRDKASAEIAAELGCNAEKISFERDLAFGVSYDVAEDIDSIKERSNITSGEPFAVIALSGNCGEGSYRYIKERCLALSREGVKTVFVGMYPREDRDISKKMTAEIGGHYIEDMGESELVTLLRTAERAIGERLHLLIFAHLAGISFEGVGEDPKIEAFCKENGGIWRFDIRDH